MFKKTKQFILEAIRELGRVTWPSRNSVLKMTVGVVIVSALFGLFASVVDLGITAGLRQLLVYKETHQTSNTSNNTSTSIPLNQEDIQVETTK